MTVHVISYDTAHPGDTSDLARRLAPFPSTGIRRLALLVKTEGNAAVNDYSRELGLLSARLVLEAQGGAALVERTTFLFSTGCEGAMTPFGYLFVDQDDDVAPTRERALVMGCASSRSLLPRDIGTKSQLDLTTQTVAAAMVDAGVTQEDVTLAIVKTPVASLVAQKSPGRRITSGQAKAVSALGAGVALGEIDLAQLPDADFDANPSLHARRAMVFSGAELDRIEVLLLANKRGAAGTLLARVGFLRDVLDGPGAMRVFNAAGCHFAEGQITNPEILAAVLVKLGATPDGRLRGNRTTMKSSHIDMDKHVRAAASGMFGAILGTTRTFISADTVHQAPPGGGLCACIVETK